MENDLIICDIDGTIALRREDRQGCRGPFDWDRVDEDEPNPAVVALVKLLYSSGYDIVFMSGRMRQCSAKTRQWLDRHVGVSYSLYMRADDDYRPDTVVKREMYEMYIPSYCAPAFVLDDRNSVVKMWREELKLTVLQVADGDF